MVADRPGRPDCPDEWYQALVRHSTDIVAVLDADGIMRYKSPAIEDHLGYKRQDIIGENVFEYVHPDDRARVKQAIQPVFGGLVSQSAPVEYRFQHADGSWLWFESILTDCTETVLDGYLVNSRDITERKHKEKALRRERDRLEEFASVLSHDLRNPLNVAMGRLELVEAECDNVHLEKIEDALDRMEVLIQDILTLAREGDEVSSLEPVELDATVERCWQRVTNDTATLVTETAQTIHADPSRLRQLLENLFRNAIEHGGGDVTVTVGTLPDNTGFYVADDGPGIPADERDQVFKSGYSTSAEGTGFGLAIVEQIVQAHDWEIKVTDSETGGARFEITGVNVV